MLSEMLCLVGMPTWRVSSPLSVEATTPMILVFVSGMPAALGRLSCVVPVITFQEICHQPKIVFQTADGGDRGGRQATDNPCE
jgi:hypothetical protein